MKLSGVPGGTVLGSRATWTIQEPSGSRECSRCSLCACARGADMRKGSASAPAIREARMRPLVLFRRGRPVSWFDMFVIRFVFLFLFLFVFRRIAAEWLMIHWFLQPSRAVVTDYVEGFWTSEPGTGEAADGGGGELCELG